MSSPLDPAPHEPKTADQNAQLAPAQHRALWRFLRGLGWVALVTAAIVVGLVVMRWQWGRRAGEALETEIQRCIAAGEPIFPNDFKPPPVPPEQNAALLLQRACAALNLTGEQTDALADLIGHPDQIAPYADEIRAALEANAETMALVRRARSAPAADWGIEFETPARWTEPYDARPLRILTRALAVAATYRHHVGNDAEAVETLLDLVAIADRVSLHPELRCDDLALLLNDEVGKCVEGLVRDLKVCEEAADAGEAKPAPRARVRALIDRLLDEAPLRDGAVKTLYWRRMVLLELARMIVDGRIALVRAYEGRRDADSERDRIIGVVLRPAFQRDGARVIRRYDALAAAIRQPYWRAYLNEAPRWTTGTGILLASQPIGALEHVDPSLEAQRLFRTLAWRRMTAVALAIRLYEVDNGRRPARLVQLVPDYLAEPPEDPFGELRRAIRYRLGGQQPMLYSVNTNGVDDRGRIRNLSNRGVFADTEDLPFYLNGEPAAIRPPTGRRGRRTRSRR